MNRTDYRGETGRDEERVQRRSAPGGQSGLCGRERRQTSGRGGLEGPPEWAWNAESGLATLHCPLRRVQERK